VNDYQGAYMKKLISLGMALLLVIVFFACLQDESPQKYNAEKDYKIKVSDDSKAVKITKCKGKSRKVQIPSHIQSLPVTTIGYESCLLKENCYKGAFEGKQLISVTIPDGVKTIEHGAFRNNQLTSVTIPNSVISIGARAFQNNQLTSITISNRVIAIGFMAFEGNQLTNVSIPNRLKTIESGVFWNNRLTSVTIPNSVTSIGARAFYKNQLISVTIPNSVTFIGGSAFGNNKLTSVTIPDRVTAIGWGAFAYNQLTSITIGANVTLRSVFDNGFDDFYRENGKKKGTYTYKDGHWKSQSCGW